MKKRYLIGIDEAGRGPLAGPVAIGAFAVPSPKLLRMFKGAKDSKQLSEKQREEWFKAIKKAFKDGSALYSVSYARAETIDSKGLTKAIYAAVNRCMKKLEKFDPQCANGEVRLDGLLSASSRYGNQRTIIGGDESELVIALASICAKVSRDRRMKRAARKFPGYGFEIHKGYGTKAHYKAIRKHGLTPLHRRSFLKGIKAK